MQIHGPHGPNGASPIFPRRSVDASESARSSGLEMPRDEIQISPEAKMLAEISQSGHVQQERIEQLREMINTGSYDTPERLAVAVDRMLNGNGAAY